MEVTDIGTAVRSQGEHLRRPGRAWAPGCPAISALLCLDGVEALLLVNSPHSHAEPFLVGGGGGPPLSLHISARSFHYLFPTKKSPQLY